MVIWTDTATSDLTNFIDNATLDTKNVAKKYIEKLINYVELLDNMNELGLKLPCHNKNYTIRQLIYKSHKIIYTTKNGDTYILSVLHSKLDFKSALQKILDEH